jgi:chromate reductase, NAD(P)H dehydrogenase (quinone)
MSEAMMVRVLCLAGSSRRDSLNRKLARVAATAVREAGGEATLIDLGDFPMPIYHGDLEAEQGPPASARELAVLVRTHHALLIASPENNASVSALLQNTIDWLSRIKEFEVLGGRVAALVAASPGAFGGVRGLYHLRAMLNTLGCEVIATQFLLPRAHQAFDAGGLLADARSRGQLAALARRLLQVAAALALPTSDQSRPV